MTPNNPFGIGVAAHVAYAELFRSSAYLLCPPRARRSGSLGAGGAVLAQQPYSQPMQQEQIAQPVGTPQSLGLYLEEHYALWLLGSLANLYRIPFDTALVAQQYPPPHTLASFHEAARALGLKTGTRPLVDIDWVKPPLPAVTFMYAPLDNSAITPPHIPVIVLKSDGQHILVFRLGSQTPEALPIDSLAGRFAPELISVARGETAAGEERIPGFETEKKDFGFSWFQIDTGRGVVAWGLGGNDVFYGGAGNDLLDGGARRYLSGRCWLESNCGAQEANDMAWMIAA